VIGTDEYVCASCNLPTQAYEEKMASLVFFRGGPLDGRAYRTADLTAKDEHGRIILPLHQYHWTPERVTSETTSQTARVWNWRGPDATEYAPEDTGERKQKMQNTASDGTTTAQLLERRQALGLSRRQVADQAGITQSQLASLEVSGKRVKEGVMDKVLDAIKHFESQPREASDKESHATV
jgi:hypothetical protein